MTREYHLTRSEETMEDPADFRHWTDRLQRELNPSQYRFVTESSPMILGLAGPGSGKTRALIYRCAHLIKSGVMPWQILLVTFTNKAAEEMKNRLEKLLGYYPQDIWAGTFHSIGARIIRSNAELAERTPNFTILDEDDRRVILKNILNQVKGKLSPEEQKLFLKRGFAGKIITQTQNSGSSIEAIMEEYYEEMAEYTIIMERVSEYYKERKRETNSYDFDDLLVKWLELFRDNPSVGEKYRRQFQHVLVDEYQDTNIVQGQIIDQLVGEGTVCVVGDDAQSIYAFRFAHIENIVDFPRKYPEAAVIKMEQNYRSTTEIVNMVNHVIANNSNQLPKELVSMCGTGEKPWVIKARDVYEEAAFVVQRIGELNEAGMSMGDMAVLYRNSFLTQDLEMELMKNQIRYRTFGGLKFAQKAHVKDIVAWVKILCNPKEEASWLRIITMQPGLGTTTAEKLVKEIREAADPLKDIIKGRIMPARGRQGWAMVQKTLTAISEKNGVSEIIYTILENGYFDYLQKNFPDNWEDRYGSLERLATYSEKYGGPRAFIESMTLEDTLFFEEGAPGETKNDFLTLSTIHSAKGKEWQAVFILAVNEGHFPSSWGDANIEEERRLFYVATSRAARYLHLMTYQNDYRWGNVYTTGPSKFLREIPPARLEMFVLQS